MCPKISQAQKTRSQSFEADLAELLLGGEPFSVSGEVSLEVSPAELTARQRQVRIGPPAIGGNDRGAGGQELLGVLLTAVGRDQK